MPEKKKFINVEVPLLDTTIQLLAFNIESLKGRTVKLDLTRQLHGKSIDATFTVKVEEERAIAEVKKLNLLKFYIMRLIHKNISYVEDSFSCKSKDALLRIKPFLITRKKVHRSIRKALREKCKELINEFCSSRKKEEVFRAVVKNELQRELILKLKKIYPLSLCEIYALQVEKEK